MLRIWLGVLVLGLCGSCMASVQAPSGNLRRARLTEREGQAWKTPARAAEFSDIPHVSARSRCEDTQPPGAEGEGQLYCGRGWARAQSADSGERRGRGRPQRAAHGSDVALSSGDLQWSTDRG